MEAVHNTRRHDNDWILSDSRVSDPLTDMSQKVGNIIYTYRSLLGGQSIDVFYHPSNRLSATVSQLDVFGRTIRVSDHLPVDAPGLQKCQALTRMRLINYFRQVYLLAEKDTDATFMRVVTRPAGLGGMKPKIPGQPGLELGALVHPDIILKMTDYAEKQSKLDSLQYQKRDVEQQIAEYQLNFDSLPQSERTVVKKSVDAEFYEEQIKNLQETLREVNVQIKKCTTKEPCFENFIASPQSPIDDENSKIQILPKATDSLYFDSQFVMRSEIDSYVRENVKKSGSAFSASVGAGWGPWGVNLAHDMTRGAASRLKELQLNTNVAAVLVVNAFVTTRHVRTYTKIEYDETRLRGLSKALSPSRKISNENYPVGRIGEEPAVLLLTQGVMGGSYTGIVTFSHKSQSSQSTEINTNEQNNTTTGSVGVRTVLSANVGGSGSTQSAYRSESDILKNLENLNVTVQICAQGAIPDVVVHKVDQELLRFKQMEQNQSQPVSVSNNNSSPSNDQTSLTNSQRPTEVVRQQLSVYTPQTIFDAYSNFSRIITSDKDAGVYVGFNYTILTKDMVEEELKKIEARRGSTNRN